MSPFAWRRFLSSTDSHRLRLLSKQLCEFVVSSTSTVLPLHAVPDSSIWACCVQPLEVIFPRVALLLYFDHGTSFLIMSLKNQTSLLHLLLIFWMPIRDSLVAYNEWLYSRICVPGGLHATMSFRKFSMFSRCVTLERFFVYSLYIHG